MIGTAFDSDSYYFHLVTYVTDKEVFVNDQDQLFAQDTNDDPFQVWRWENGKKLIHVGCTDLDSIINVPSKLVGKYITH